MAHPIHSVRVPARAAGTSGLNLPAMGLGCWSFGGGEYWGPQGQDDADAVVHAALDAGANYFDTAEVYNGGASESSLGLALKGRRQGAIIGTKVGPHNTTPALLRAHCEASLRRLRTDVIDLYMVHWPISANALGLFTRDPEVLKNPPAVGDAFRTLGDLRREGKIRHVGVSNFGVQQLTEALAAGVPIAANQLPYSLLSRGIELSILPFCRAKGIGTIGYMSLMQGLLAGKFVSLDRIPPERMRTRHFAGTRKGSRHGEAGLERETWAAVQATGKLAAEAGMSMSNLAVAWSMANPDLTCTLVGCRNAAQLAENLDATAVRLSPDLLARLDGVTAEVLARMGDKVDLFQGAKDSRTL